MRNRLNYETLKTQESKEYRLENAPERVLQFGEGNFLRAFADYFIDVMNEKTEFKSKVVVCQPIEQGLIDMLNEQEGLYTLFLRGFEQGKRVEEKRLISCISRGINPYENYQAVLDCAKNPELRYIICNTTEAGITYDDSCKLEDAPASSFPGKLTQLMYERFLAFGKKLGKGFVILSCELIDDNGKELERCVMQYAKQWDLDRKFISWIEEENVFCSTLVDRIVTGYPRKEAQVLCEQLGYEDTLLNTSEVFGLWVIEGPEWLKKELPFEEAGLPVLITDNHKPYKERKVRILNGAHTSFVLGAYLAGQNIVRDSMEDEGIYRFMNHTLYEEVMPTLDLPKEEVEAFASSVYERFKNPFIDHELLSITLNSTAKWKARVLPSLKAYVEKYDKLPPNIVASFACYLSFYRGDEWAEEGLIGKRGEESYIIKDDRSVLEYYYACREYDIDSYVKETCAKQEFWGEDLGQIPNFANMVIACIRKIEKVGMKEFITTYTS